MPIFLDDRNDDYRSDYRRLVKLSEREAYDPNTGDRYRIERQEQPGGPGGGLVLAIVLGVLLWMLANAGTTPRTPRPLLTPDGIYPTNPSLPIG
ncbi:MAG: hypothetical protein D6742_06545 [Cyanobacteria bacterium J069]|nr:MAG: hypothetical protein D6742_06545 [Cyanobacteria bacterium J069]